MSEYIVQHDTMVGIADAVRTMTGTADKLSPDQIATSVTAGNTEVDTQSDLIAQISAALDGKAGGGSGAVETCTVNITNTASKCTILMWSIIGYDEENEKIDLHYNSNTEGQNNLSFNDVICGSTFTLFCGGMVMPNSCAVAGGAELLAFDNVIELAGAKIVVKAPAVAGSVCTCTIE